jgi:uncharacterized membrane protein
VGLLNNLEIKKCLLTVGAIVLGLVGLIGLAALGFDVPVLRQVLGFLFLTLVPGSLILRILKIHNISTAESLVYSVGLSLAFVMFGGLLVNTVSPVLGITKPISLLPFVMAFTGLILVLAIIAFLRDKDFRPQVKSSWRPTLSPPYLFLILLPLMAVLGALLVNYYQNNILLLIFLVALATVVGFVGFGRFVPEAAYPLATVMMSISLLYMLTLFSSAISSYDIQVEYSLQNSVIQSGYWDPATPGNVNTALSIVMLSPIYSLVLAMPAIYIFKVVYSLFFCLVPLALFLAYREQVGAKRAFFSAFLLISVLSFAGSENRQEVAEFFLALFVLLMATPRLNRLQKSALAIICIMAIPVSHYGLAYILLGFFILCWALINLLRTKAVTSWSDKFTKRFAGPLAQGDSANPAGHLASPILSRTLVSLYLVFALAFYMYTASGTMFTTIVTIPQHIIQNISEFFNALARESLVVAALGGDIAKVSMMGKAFRVVQYAVQFLIIVGFIRLMLKSTRTKFTTEYSLLTAVSALMLFACIAIPYFSGYLETERFYRIALLFLAPLCVLGGEAIWQGLSMLIKRCSLRVKLRQGLILAQNRSNVSQGYLGALALVVLIPYFLFNSGFIFEVTRSELYDVVDTPSSVALSSYRLDMKASNHREQAGNEWLSRVVDSSSPIYADIYAALPISGLIPGRVRAFPFNAEGMPENTYIYLKTWNLNKNESVLMMSRGERIWFEHISFDAQPELSRLIRSKGLIYDNGGARVFAP